MRVAVEAVKPADFRQRFVAEARFRETSDDPDLIYDLVEEILPIQAVREEAP